VRCGIALIRWVVGLNRCGWRRRGPGGMPSGTAVSIGESTARSNYGPRPTRDPRAVRGRGLARAGSGGSMGRALPASFLDITEPDNRGTGGKSVGLFSMGLRPQLRAGKRGSSTPLYYRAPPRNDGQDGSGNVDEFHASSNPNLGRPGVSDARSWTNNSARTRGASNHTGRAAPLGRTACSTSPSVNGGNRRIELRPTWGSSTGKILRNRSPQSARNPTRFQAGNPLRDLRPAEGSPESGVERSNRGLLVRDRGDG